MSKIRARNGNLCFDITLRGKRYREQSRLPDTAANRKAMQKVLDRIDAEIMLGTFDYAKYFPTSRNAAKFVQAQPVALIIPVNTATPLLKDFADTWFNQFSVSWRRSHTATIRSTLDRHIIAAFGKKEVGLITRADVLNFRSSLGKVPGRNGNKALSNRRYPCLSSSSV